MVENMFLIKILIVTVVFWAPIAFAVAGNKHYNEDKRPNHLINETSPYLLQHAFNPVAWYPWGDEALAKAKQENKPILLSIGYSTCHWCHVMEKESFTDHGTAEIMNRNFVCIKWTGNSGLILIRCISPRFRLSPVRQDGPLTFF